MNVAPKIGSPCLLTFKCLLQFLDGAQEDMELLLP